MRFFSSIWFLFVFLSFSAHAQNGIDSLRKILKGKESDSIKIQAHVGICQALINNPTERNSAIKEMSDFCEQIEQTHLKALCLRKVGVMYGRISEFDKALEYSFRSAELFEKKDDKFGLANCFNNIASFYNQKASLTKDDHLQERSLEYHFKGMQLRIAINDTSELVNSYNNIGNTYMSMEEYNKALDYFKKAQELYIRKGEESSIQMINSNLGECYYHLGIKENNAGYLRTSLHYLLSVYRKQKTNVNSIHESEINSRIGKVYTELGNLSVGLPFLEKGLAIAKHINNKSAIEDALKGLAEYYLRLGNHKKAFEMQRLQMMYKDSLINEKNISSIEQMQTAYQTSEKDKQIDKLNTEKAIKDSELETQRVVIFSVIGAIVSTLLIIIVIYSRYNLKKKANLQLQEAYHNIEIKNKQITDSINYARRIQQALLPPQDLLKKHFNDFFVYYAPKDIVSGDFYWFTEHQNRLYVAVADCTGHGVPGALMSMIGNTLLHEIINQKNISSPGDILFHLDKGVKNALRQSGSDLISQDDGMDISICCIDVKQPLLLEYACANHSIFVKSGKTVTELTGDIFSIGGDYSSVEKTFETKTHPIEPNAYVVMSTDGYYDQFGGEKGSKFLISRFEKLIAESDFEKHNQPEIFSEAILLWRGLHKQTDDILVAGFKI
jgi:serine phosphatase RsbU (regulator of sigma subunit)